MEPSADCVVQPLIPTVAKYHVVPLKYIMYDGFKKNNLPDPRLCWIRNVDDDLKRMYLFMRVVTGINPDLLLQLDIPGLMIDDVDGCYRIWEILRKIQHALGVHWIP